MADTNNFVQVQDLYLAGSGVALGDTSVIVQSFTYPDGTTLVAMADFGAIGYGTFEPGTPREENFSFTGITQNGNGTATLTGVTKGLGFKTPYTAVSANRFAHAGSTRIVISNSAPFYNEITAKDNDETITGLWDFSQFPTTSAGSPTDDNQLAPKSYVDAQSTGTTNVNRIVVAGNAGETVVDGNLLYLKTADNEWYKTDADTAGTVDNVLLGIAQGAGTNGNAITNGILILGVDDAQSGLTPGAAYYASNSAGGISSSAGTTEVTVGLAKSATELYFSPRFNQQLTEAQQDLLDGITASATEINITDGLTATTAQLNEAGTFFGATDISGAEAETLTASATSDASSLHTHSTLMKKINVTTTDVVISSTTEETTLFTASIPANTLGTNNGVRLCINIGALTLRSGATDGNMTFNFKYGGTTMVTFTVNHNSGGTLSPTGKVYFDLFASGATNTQDSFAEVLLMAGGTSAGGATSLQHIHATGAGTATEDSTGALNLVVTVTFGISTSTITASNASLFRVS